VQSLHALHMQTESSVIKYFYSLDSYVHQNCFSYTWRASSPLNKNMWDNRLKLKYNRIYGLYELLKFNMNFPAAATAL
jgi:hypothetical protein